MLSIPSPHATPFLACFPTPIAKVDALIDTLRKSPDEAWRNVGKEFLDGWQNIKEQFETHLKDCKEGCDPNYQFVMFSVEALAPNDTQFGCGMADSFARVETAMQMTVFTFNERHPLREMYLVLDLMDYKDLRTNDDRAALQRCRVVAETFNRISEMSGKLDTLRKPQPTKH